MNDVKKRAFWTVGAAVAYAGAYLLCRFVFFDLHHMRQWPDILALAGLAVLIVALILDCRKLSLFTIIGYIGGFALAMLFNSDGVDQGGGRTNNAWLIWGIAFIVIVVVGLVLEIIYRKRNKRLEK